MRFTDPACTSCGHAGTGTKRYADDSSGMGRNYDPPPADCACECHAAWRMVQGVPAVASDAAA